MTPLAWRCGDRVLNWLRQRVRFLERRWIHDPEERTQHEEVVRERLAAGPDTSEASPELLPPDAIETPLAGGMDPRFAPVRVGDTVRRSAGAFREAVRALLLHLETIGWAGAPRHLGFDAQGREVLSFVEGDVPLPPYPGWAMTDAALGDLGALVRRFHEATASFAAPAGADWATDWADPLGGSAPDAVVCHNDLYPENVVFRDGMPVAMIDFAMAAPGRPLWDLAVAAETWCPLGDPAHRDQHPADLDGIRRLRALVRGYGLAPERARELVGVLMETRAHSLANIRAEMAAGNASWIATWDAAGGDERAAADDAWIAANRTALVRAAGG